jgi:antitoxin component YwqK of YwqJK toxin-antitoxin module
VRNNPVKVKRIIWFLSILALAGSCSQGKQDKSPGSGETVNPETGIRVIKEYYPNGSLKSETEALGKLRHGVSKEYRQDGTLENLINYQNNRKHGPAYNYYPDGSTVKLEINYVSGYKNGETKWFYKDGNVYRVTPYVKGKITGIRRTYYKNGILQAELPFQDNQPGMGLKEYRTDGSPRKFDAKIVFSERDRISMDNTFTLTITLSDGSRNVEYYSGKLTDGKFWNDQLAPIRTENGAGIMEFYVSKGTFKMETLNIVARIKTNLDNYLIIQREYHLALENKF